LQTAQEKFYMQNNSFTDNLEDASPDGLGLSATTETGKYTVLGRCRRRWSDLHRELPNLAPVADRPTTATARASPSTSVARAA
jgi:hypothetical protein